MVKYHPAFDELDKHIRIRMEAIQTPGLALALFDREQSVYIGTYGAADFNATHPVGPETLFPIGSITKSFVALAVMQAVDDGLIDLQKPVTNYLPWFEVQSEYAPMTIHHLLTHSAGLTAVIDEAPDPVNAVWMLRQTSVGWAGGDRFSYSDAGYQVLGLVLEELREKSLQVIFQEFIFEPLGMNSSAPARTNALRPHTAIGLCSIYDDRPFHQSHPLVPAPWIESDAGDSCIASTVEDMAAYGRMLLNGGMGQNERIISEEGFAQMIEPTIDAVWCHYGYGQIIREHNEQTYIGHSGGIPGAVAHAYVDQESGLGAVVLSSTPYADDIFWPLVDFWQATYLGPDRSAIDFAVPDPTMIENAADYVGFYQSDEGAFRLEAGNGHLVMIFGGDRIPLEARGSDAFYVAHPAFDRFMLTFERERTSDSALGDVTEAFHGPKWYINDRYSGPRTFDYPADWGRYVGHYRAHMPWDGNNFRIIIRKGQLLLVESNGYEERLHPRDDGSFRLGGEPSPNIVCFDRIINGQACRVNRSGTSYYRFFTE